MKLIGVDTGGTFTDFVLFDGGRLRIHKVLSTPQSPERAILQGIREMGLDARGLRVIHGSTVATNAALERKGVRTVYITNRGLGDLLTIGRQARRELYNLQPTALAPPVPRELCVETGGRLAADGSVVEPLTEGDLDHLLARLHELHPRAVAINLLYAYLDDEFERRIEALVPHGVFCSRSSAVLPEIGEYERGIATWLNSWLGPLVEGYIRCLCEGLPDARVAVMQSSGEAIAAEQAAHQAVRMLLSGPAGGLVGAGYVGAAAGRSRLLSFDMGGTSSDVALLDGAPRLTREGRIGPWPVAVPMVDMHTIGAGGGSIARLDAGGMLLVGPESAGADPGPACYARGGMQATVTDANLLLGRLQAHAFLGGRMTLDVEAARQAVGRLADAMGQTLEHTAMGIIRVANEHMARALRVISVQRGVDPRGFTLASFGGAGGLHVCALADALGMRSAMVPVQAGVLSALGMLVARPGRQRVRTRLGLLRELDERQLEDELRQLAQGGLTELVSEGVAVDQVEIRYALDLRYRGQSYTLSLPWTGCRQTESDFHDRHVQRYGHRMDTPVELVNLRAALEGPGHPVALEAVGSRVEGKARSLVELYGVEGAVPCYERDDLASGQGFDGPALITDTVATTWIAPGWQCRVHQTGSLLLERAP
ncbi:MAG: hydantoinase/oxoprolinase family protein [Gammaproteobacteria bacterium]|nr:hydantoinase/oxoprolinase family protein [Gammaproteobacteria bacterium]